MIFLIALVAVALASSIWVMFNYNAQLGSQYAVLSGISGAVLIAVLKKF